MQNSLETGYSRALDLAKNHYENFPVVSVLIKKELRKHIAIVYWFARTADDIADEGVSNDSERQKKLNSFREDFVSKKYVGEQGILFEALWRTINEYSLDPKLFLDLLSAFEQDINKKRYKDYNELLDYCKRSANPVGRIILGLYGIKDKKSIEHSDYICTALQIINFLQDISIDLEKKRIYIPIEDCDKFGVNEKSFEIFANNDKLQKLIQFYVENTRNLMGKGKPLLENLPGLLKYEISWTIYGGLEILNKIEKNNYNIRIRPKLNKTDILKILIKSVIK